MALAPLLLVYDAESARCRAVADWVQRRDRRCLVIAFPIQNPELVRLAPELAGLPLLGEVHSLDTRTRAVRRGAALLPGLLQRLPGWNWFAPLAGLPPFSMLIYALMRRPVNS